MTSNKKAIKKYLKEFKSRLPLKDHFVKFAFKDIKDAGLCYGPYIQKKTNKKFVYIVISKNLSYNEQLDTLIHEYAHALAIDKGLTANDDLQHHGPMWGNCYSKVYRTWLKISKEEELDVKTKKTQIKS